MYKVTPYRTNTDLFNLFDDFFSDTKSYHRTFKVDVQDLEKEYIVEADVPGFTKENIEIHFEKERLVISINKEETQETEDENKNYVHRERFTESARRSIYLKDVDPKQFKAKLENGVLTITAQKQEEKINKYTIDID